MEGPRRARRHPRLITGEKPHGSLLRQDGQPHAVEPSCASPRRGKDEPKALGPFEVASIQRHDVIRARS
jgi:hypothetical protein